jgi:hypothetical protein
MRHLCKLGLILLPAVALALAGCSSSSNGGSANDPFASASGNTANGSRLGTIFGNVSTATGKTGITLSTDRTSVDANNGQVVVTARIVGNGVALAGIPVSFSIAAPLNGPATVEAGLTTVTTDSNGMAITRVTTGNTLSTTSVIVNASASIGSQHASANTTFQIVRGTGVIAFGATPAESAQSNPSLEAHHVFQKQIPLRLTDANGNPRVGVAVTLSVYTNSGTASVEFAQKTVNTDASGAAIFNATVTMPSPTPGFTVADSVIFKATTSDANPIVGYAAGYYSLTSITPGTTLPGGVIMFTSAAGLQPGDQTNLIPSIIKEVDTPPDVIWSFLQLIPFKVTDSNGNPRMGVPVTLSVYSITTAQPDDVVIDFLVPPITESKQQTVTTDSAGQGVFNVAAQLRAFSPGETNNVDAVFKAVTNDTTPVTAYVGATYSLKSKLPILVIAPNSTAFSTTSSREFSISGGAPPYQVSSDNSGRVTATLHDNNKVTAVLVDTTQWTGSITISVTDAKNQTAAATLSR